jgi:hypothetical protein
VCSSKGSPSVATQQQQQQQQQQQATAPAKAPAESDILQAALDAVTGLATALSDDADQQLSSATAAALPLLRMAGSSSHPLVQQVRDGLRQLHRAAASASGMPAGVQQAVMAALRSMAAQPTVEAPPVEQAGAGAAGAGAGAAPTAATLGAMGPQAAVAQQKHSCEQQAWIQEQPCQVCGSPDGDQLVYDACLRCWHLEHVVPAPLAAVPEGTWLCSECEAVAGLKEAVEEALSYHGRWVMSKFPRVAKAFWGQVSYSSMGCCSIMYSDGETWDGVSVRQVRGQDVLEGHSWVKLQPGGPTQEVLDVFQEKGWLVGAES